MESTPTLLARCPVLREMIETQTALDPHGRPVPLHSGVSVADAEALYQQIRGRKPTQVVEVGMAFGVSTLAILTALSENGAGRLTSIDPLPQDYGRCGLAAVERAGFSSLHRLIEQPSALALPELLAAGTTIEFGYIDGWHTFDAVLLDLWYLDRMLLPGGLLGFNDCGWPAIGRAIRFLETHRRYREIAPPLPTFGRRVRAALSCLRHGRLGEYQVWRDLREEDRYLEKLEAWEPRWDFYAPF
jgi:predicted O-methyltransferase YrrM